MDTYLWIAAGFAAACAVGAGLLKLTQPRTVLVEKGQGWAEDFTDPQVKLLGVAELLGAAGLILPPLLGVAEILTPVAATCLALLWAGAVATHVRRKELKELVPPAALVAMAVFVAYGRFGDWSF